MALEPAICFHASRRGDAEDPPRMGAEVQGGHGVGVGGARTERGMGFSGPKLARLLTEPRCHAVLWMCVVPVGVVGLVPCCSPRAWAGPGGTLVVLDLGEVSASPWKVTNLSPWR